MKKFNIQKFLKEVYHFDTKVAPNRVNNQPTKNRMQAIIKQCKFDVKDVLSYLDQLIEEHFPEYKGKFISKKGWKKVYDVYTKSNVYPQLNKMLEGCKFKTEEEYHTHFLNSVMACGLDPDILITQLYIDTIGWDRMIDTLVKMYVSSTEGESKTETAVDTEKDSVSPRETAKTESEEEKEVKTSTEPKEKKEKTESTPKTSVEPTTPKRKRGGKKEPILQYYLDGTFAQEWESVSRAAEELNIQRTYLAQKINENKESKVKVRVKDYLWIKKTDATDSTPLPDKTTPINPKGVELIPCDEEVGKDCEKTCVMDSASIPADDTSVDTSKDVASSGEKKVGKGGDETCPTETTSVPTEPTTDVSGEVSTGETPSPETSTPVTEDKGKDGEETCVPDTTSEPTTDVSDEVSTGRTSSPETSNPTEIVEGRKLCAYYYNGGNTDGEGQLYKTYRTQKEAAEDLGKSEAPISKSVKGKIKYVCTPKGKLYFKWIGEKTKRSKVTYPFLSGLSLLFRYQGGKSKEMKEFKHLFPRSFNSYYEPFVGGGSVFMGVKANEYYINDFSSDVTSIYQNISTSNEEFYKYCQDIITTWDNAKDFCVKFNEPLNEIYKKYKKGNLSVESLQETVNNFCDEHQKDILDIIGDLSKYPCILINQIKEDIVTGMVEMIGKDADGDFLSMLETYVKNSVYENYIALFNDKNIEVVNPTFHSALYLYTRQYCFGGYFQYNKETKLFNVKFEKGKKVDYSMQEKIDYYRKDKVREHFVNTQIFTLDYKDFLERTNPGEDSFIFLDPPYDETHDDYNNLLFGANKHKELATYLKENCKAKWMMVIKETPLIRELYTDPNIHILHSYPKKYKNAKEVVTHLVITNYTLDEVQSASVENVSVKSVSTDSSTMAA